MNSKFILPLAAATLALALAACGGTTGNSTVTDGSGNPVRIGTDSSATTGPGSPGWPQTTGAARNH
jgi:hypothetical protein